MKNGRPLSISKYYLIIYSIQVPYGKVEKILKDKNEIEPEI